MLKQFIRMSKYAGMREDLIQAGGGNSSVKLDRRRMLIKASGVQLADITQETGYATVNPEVIVEYFDKETMHASEQDGKALLNACLLSGMRPSIETFLHSATAAFTLHTHPMVVNVLTARKNGMQVLHELFPEALLVDYATPGIRLAEEYFKACKNSSNNGADAFELIFLKNHGMIVSGKTGEEVIRKTEEVLGTIENYLAVTMTPYHDATRIYDAFREAAIAGDELIIYLAADSIVRKAAKKFAADFWEFWFCPDCLVYCGKRPLVLNGEFSGEEIRAHALKYGQPVIIYYQENVYIAARNLKKAKEIESVLAFSAHVALLNESCEMDLLSEREQDFLLDWESEKYRKNL